MKVIFLHHSSFLVELEHTILLFDYFAGERVGGFHFTGVLPLMDILDKITYVAPEKKYELGSLKIRTLASTDAGVAFCVDAEAIRIYHAGDLNWWHWEGVGDLVNGRMARDFKREMRRIENEHFHLAFVPLDPRQEKDAFKGFGYFMQNVDADHVFPMHMWQDYSLIRAYKKRTDNGYFLSRIVDITKENEVFVFPAGTK